MADRFYIGQTDFILQLNLLDQQLANTPAGFTLAATLPIVVTPNGSTKTISIAAATTSLPGSMSAADKLKLDGIATSANNYSLPAATGSTLGGVKIGANMSIDGSGFLTTTVTNTPVPINYASSSTTPATSIGTGETSIGTASLSGAQASAPVLVVARANFTKDTGATQRNITLKLRRGTTAGTQIGVNSVINSQSVASTVFVGSCLAVDTGQSGGTVQYTFSATGSAASCATCDSQDIQIIELKAVKGDTGAQGVGVAVNDAVINTTNTWSSQKISDAISTGGGVTLTNTVTLQNKTLQNPAWSTQTLTDGSSIAWDMNNGQIANVTIQGNRNINAPGNMKPGFYVINVTQGPGGNFGLTWDSVFKFNQSSPPQLSTISGLTDSIMFISNGVQLFGGMWSKGQSVSSTPPGPAQSPGPTSPSVPSSVSAVDRGTNLSGMEWLVNVRSSASTSPNINYTVPRASDLTYLRYQGMTKIRLPFQWEMIQPLLFDSAAGATVRSGYGVTSNGDLYSVYTSYISLILNAAASVGMKVILDMHNYCRYKDFIYNGDGTVTAFVNPADPLTQPYTTDGTKIETKIMSLNANGKIRIAHFTDVWSKIANLFKGHPGLGGYGLMNEPHDLPGPNGIFPWNDPQSGTTSEDLTIWPTFAQAAINAIRGTGAAEPIYVSGNQWGGTVAYPTANPGYPLTGSNLIYEAHLYLDASNSGSAFNYDAEVARGFSVGENGSINANTGVNRLAYFTQWCSARNVKGAIGEVGMPLNDSRWTTMFSNAITAAVTAGLETYTWMGGNHVFIRGFEINHVPDFYQNKTLHPMVQGVLQKSYGVHLTPTLYDEGPTYGLSGAVLSITVRALGWLESNLTLTVSSNNGGTISGGGTITLLAGANPSATYTYTTGSDRIATLTYTGSSQVPPPRKIYSLIDPVTYAATSVTDAAKAILGKYRAGAWLVQDAYTDYMLGSACSPGNEVRAISDSGNMSNANNCFSMLAWHPTGPSFFPMPPSIFGTDATSGKRYMDLTPTSSRGTWVKKVSPNLSSNADPNPTNRMTFDVQDAHFMMACISIASSSGTNGVVMECSQAESANCISQMTLSSGVPSVTIKDGNGTPTTLNGSGSLNLNTPQVVTVTSVAGAQSLRVNSAVLSSTAATMAPGYYNQILFGGGFPNFYPVDSFRGRGYGCIAGPGAPNTSELNVLEVYLMQAAGGTLALSGGGGGGTPTGGVGDNVVTAITPDIWWDPSAPNVVYLVDQVTLATSRPVASGKMLDRSGNGRHYLEPVNTSGAIWETDSAGKFDLNIYDPVQIPSGGGSTTGFFLCIGLDQYSGHYLQRTIFSDRAGQNGYLFGLDTSNHYYFNVGTAALGFPTVVASSVDILSGKYVVTCWHDSSAGTINIQVNNGNIHSISFVGNVDAGSSACAYDGENDVNLLGAGTHVGYHKHYGMVIKRNSPLTVSDRTNIKNWVANKMGISI